MNPLNPLDNIRLSCERVVQTSQHCKICQDVVETIADSIMVEGHDNFCQGKHAIFLGNCGTGKLFAMSRC